MIKRESYLNSLAQWQNEQVIKVITGIRRCGKSTLMQQFQDSLRANGVEEEQIISINFEDLDFEELLDYKKLHNHLKALLVKDKYTYIFLDEIQKVPEFEKVVDSLYVKPNVDIYITGSNAYLLSGDLATLLSGRYVEIKMLPLSFREYVDLGNKPTEEGLAEYIQSGSLPYVATMNRTSEKVSTYLEGIYNTVIVKDIEERQARKEKDLSKRKISDISLLKSIAKYLSSVIGSPVSIKGITDYLVSSGKKVSPNTVNDYVEALVESFVCYPVDRINVVGKHLLKTNKKLYMVDLGLRNHILPRRNYDFGLSIENLVYLELLRRGYKVFIGKIGNTEVDFVTEKLGQYAYWQVSADLTAEETFNREIKPLQDIKDNYEKTIITMDRNSLGNYNGIKVIHLLDWLCKKLAS